MEYKLYRLASDIFDLERKQFTDNFIDQINIALAEENIYISEDSNSKYNIVLVESGGCEKKFLDLFPTLSHPIILICTQRYNSLAAALEIYTYASKHGNEPYLYFGEQNSIPAFIKRINLIVETLFELDGENVGVIGEPSDWLIASNVSKDDAKKIFGINIIDIDYDEFINEINKKEYVAPKQYEYLLEKVGNRKDDLEQSLYIYGALKRLVKKYKLGGLTVRCFDLINTHKSTACLALSLLNSENIISSCEGDVASLISMLLLFKLLGFSSFQANPSTIDIKNNEILFSHCTLPLNMCSSYELDTHFESGLGIGIKGELEKGYVTLFKISNDFKNVIAMEGQIIENYSLPNHCRTQILVKISEHDMINYVNTPVGNHMIIAYGKQFHKITQLMSIIIASLEDNK